MSTQSRTFEVAVKTACRRVGVTLGSIKYLSAAAAEVTVTTPVGLEVKGTLIVSAAHADVESAIRRMIRSREAERPKKMIKVLPIQ